jgi:hypothetical protein
VRRFHCEQWDRCCNCIARPVRMRSVREALLYPHVMMTVSRCDEGQQRVAGLPITSMHR